MFELDHGSPDPVYEQIIRRIKMLCLQGVLQPGDKLPSVRELAGMIVANPNTVSKAYQVLEREGVIETRPGKGTFVAAGADVRVEDPKRAAELQRRVADLVLDAHYAGIDADRLKTWIDAEYERWGGRRHA